jgi:hypothetical protein
VRFARKAQGKHYKLVHFTVAFYKTNPYTCMA